MDIYSANFNTCQAGGGGGFPYFCVFVDDDSGYYQVAFMQTPADMFQKFKVLNEHAKTRFGHGIKMLLTDNAKKFLTPVRAYCKDNDIVHVTWTPYVHQENAVAE